MYKNIIKILSKKLTKWSPEFETPYEVENTLFEKTDTKLWLIANYTVMFFIILSVIIVWIDTIPDLTKEQKHYIFIIDFIISSVFLIEYIYRLVLSDNRLKFPFKIINIFDLLSFLPFFILVLIYWIWSYSIFALFRIFRIFRIFELTQRIPVINKLITWINKHKIEYLAAIFIIIIILTVFSSLVYLSEQKWWNSELFRSIPDTFWWAIVTTTTTWYWDIVPISFIWKFIASILMFIWPILVAILSSITVIVFLDSTKIIDFSKKELICKNCGKANPNDSNYCNKCWKKI